MNSDSLQKHHETAESIRNLLLAYRPKPKTKAQRKRARKAKKEKGKG